MIWPICAESAIKHKQNKIHMPTYNIRATGFHQCQNYGKWG